MRASETFSLEGYAALICGLVGQGYRVCDFLEAVPARRDLVLRHDIDQSIGAARQLAKKESANGWRATYFVLLRTEMYNPCSTESLRDLMHIMSLGHAIGLHFDPSLYGGVPHQLEEAAAHECAVLEAALGRPIAMISFHRPPAELLGRTGQLAGRRTTYEPAFFQEMGYCSDSRGGWHHGHPFDHAAVREGRALQLLTHAVWWTAHEGETPGARLERIALERDVVVRSELARNNSMYGKAG